VTLLTGETDVFSAATGGRCGVAFLARRRATASREHATAVTGVRSELAAMSERGWQLSVTEMLGGEAEPTAYDAGFAHDVDVVGVFDAPDLAAALAGSVALEAAGWDRLFSTEWLVGPREFAPVAGPDGDSRRHDWGFLALWEWNDAWQAATDTRRREYDAQCDIAFAADVRAGVTIAGRHRLDWASRWHHLGVWEVPDPDVLGSAMREHELVADFEFTTSRHYIGRRRPIVELMEGAP
jgi:hypothetical protein